MKILKDPTLFIEKNFINGEWITSEKKYQVDNPATLEIIGRMPYFDYEKTKEAISYAEIAFSLWKKTTSKERSNFMKKWFQLILENSEDLAKILTIEQGKPIAEAKVEIYYAASYIEWFAEESKRIYGDTIPANYSKNRILILKEPIGVVGTITPWNFPAAMLIRKVAAAFAAGCTVVSKPSELTPFTAMAFAYLAEKANLPKGVWNLITGDFVSIGKELTENPKVKKISFTGSTKTGSILMSQSSSTIKKLSLELGGNAPFIVFEDADLEEALKGAVLSKFRNSGQTCVCTNRFYIHKNLYSEFLEKFSKLVAQLKIGNGLDEDVNLGPLISNNAIKKVESHISDAISKGANLIYGGKKHILGGNFFEPTIISDINESMLLNQEETFGPVAGVKSFHDIEEGISLANNTQYGLAAYFYSKNISTIWNVAEKLEAGMVGINEGIISSEQIPFGGIKQSGFGREGSKYGIEEYLNLKYLCFGGINE